MAIGTKIRRLREEKKVSQRELASKIGIEQTTLGNIENGNTKKIDFSPTILISSWTQLCNLS
jgi:transcriptional regulator with XRE-family HTH domain